MATATLLLDNEALPASSQEAFEEWLKGFVGQVNKEARVFGREDLQDAFNVGVKFAQQGASLPPSRADLGGDRINQDREVHEFLHSPEAEEGFRKAMANPMEVLYPCGTIASEGSPLRDCPIHGKECFKRREALAEGQQSSTLVEKTPSASPGERESR